MGTVLVTGAAGFIANRVARDLAAEHKVVAIDNVNDYYDVRLKEHRIEALDGIEFHRIDIENKAAMQPLFEENQFDAVVNLAARAGVRYSMENPHVYMTTNAHGSLNLLELMREFDVKKYVLASTSSLYAGQQMPFVESLAVNTPISPYAASKKAAEVMAYSYHFLFGIDVTVVRYFTVYGPAGRPDMSIFRFIQWIDQGVPIELFGDGSQSRDFTYVDDIASGTIAALKPVGYEIINLGGGNQPISMNTVIATLEDLLRKKAKINYRDFHKADLKATWADISKANDLLGWETKISLQEGLENSVKGYVDHRPWSSSLDLGTA